MCATRFFRISAAKMGPNLFHQNRTVSWLMSIPRSARRSSTLRSDSGYFTYIITARRIISGELLKYRNGSFILEAAIRSRIERVTLEWAAIRIALSHDTDQEAEAEVLTILWVAPSPYRRREVIQSTSAESSSER